MQILILLPLLSALCSAVANIIAKHLLQHIRPRQFLPLTFTAISIAMTPVAAARFSLHSPVQAAPLIAFIVVIDALANLLYFRAVSIQQVSRANALGATAPLFTAIFAGFLLPQHLTAATFLAAVTVTAGIILLKAPNLSLLSGLDDPKTFLALLSALLFGFSAVPVRYLLQEYALTNPATFYWLRALAIAVILFITLQPDLSTVSRRDIVIIGGRSWIVIGQWLALLYAIQTANIVASVALAYTAPLFTLILARKAFHDTITRRKVLGILCIVAGIIILKLPQLA